MAKAGVITSIDLGTDKSVVLVATTKEEGGAGLQVVGLSVVPTKGMKKSQIVDLEKVMSSLTQALDSAERMAGMNIDRAIVSVSGAHIRSLNSKGVVAVSSQSQEIASSDVDRVIEAARAISIPPGQEVIHVIPRDFTVDSQDGVKDPVGMTGIRLESEAHIITALQTALKNTSKCLQDLGIEVERFAFAGLAASEATLTETERELGVASIDIGAGSTTICVYSDGAISHSATIPVGARHITQDIALGCRISLQAAEKVKLSLSENKTKGTGKEAEIDLASLNIHEGTAKLSRKLVVDRIIHSRVSEIFQLILDELKDKHLLEAVPAGLVVSGGGAQTISLVEVAKRVTRLPVRLATLPELGGVSHDLQSPSYATAVGLLLLQEQAGLLKRDGAGGGFSLPGLSLGSLGRGIKRLFSSLLP